MLFFYFSLVSCFSVMLSGVSNMRCTSPQQTTTDAFVEAVAPAQATAYHLADIVVRLRSTIRPARWTSGHNALLWIASGKYTP
jgi:hypothetical protein